MSVALQCSECGRAIHSTALNGVCTFCLVNTTRTQLYSSPSSSEAEALWPGRTVGPQGRFMLLKKIGQGGMGEIWLANDEHLSNGRDARPVALKFICEEIRTNRRAMELLRDEVARTQSLNHPNIVRIHDMHATMVGTPFIKMEYVEGDSLAQWLRSSGEPLPWRLICDLGAQVALALDYAHRVGNLVHRDVKPGNVLVGHGPGGLCAKLTDFGIAQALQDPRFDDDSEPTGTMAYASPEQIQGRPPAPSDDVYALGASLFELLTGTLPYSGGSFEALQAQAIYTVPENLNERLRRLGSSDGVPSDLANLVAQCLAKDVAARPTMKRVAAMLGQLRVIAGPDDIKPEKKSWWQPLAMAACLGLLAYAAYHFELLKTLRASAPTATNGSVPQVPRPKDPPEEKSDSVGSPITDGEPVTSTPPAPAPAKGQSGWVAVTINSPKTAWRTVTVSHKNQVIKKERLRPTQREHFFHESTEPGEYTISVAQDSYSPDAKAERVLSLEPGKTNASFIYFGTKNVGLRSEPPSTVVWHPATYARTTEANGTTRLFDTEVPYQFTFSKKGYEPLTVVRTFTGSLNETLVVQLSPKKAPEFGLNAPIFWTNHTMGMVFRLIDDLRVCTTETTVGQFRRFVEATGATNTTNGMFSMTSTGRRQAGHSWRNAFPGQGDDHPVVGVSEEDARAFCDWLSLAAEGLLEAGQEYRLPTSAEWRAFSGAGLYPWGDSSQITGNFSGVEVHSIGGDYRWPHSFPHLENHDDGWPRTARVTAGPLSREALYFIAGNAAEWCQGGFACGGSWFDGETVAFYGPLDTLRTDELIQVFPTAVRDDRIGFRVVITNQRSKQ